MPKVSIFEIKDGRPYPISKGLYKLFDKLRQDSTENECYQWSFNAWWLMNFISHFFLDREHPEKFFAIGAATPDLLSIYNPGLRIKKHHVRDLDTSAFSPDDLYLLEGVNRHFHADAVFHTSKFFMEETQWITNEFRRRFEEDSIPRTFFIAHILLELILDKALIHKYPGLLESYYEHYSAASLFEIKESTQLIAGYELKNYESFLEKFREHKYLFHYKKWDHIIFVLKKIMERVKINNHAFTADPRFLALLEEFELRLEKSHEQAFSEIEDNS